MQVVLETLEGMRAEALVTGWWCSSREAVGPWGVAGQAAGPGAVCPGWACAAEPGDCLIACWPHSLLVSSQHGDERADDSCSFCNVPLPGSQTACGLGLCLRETLERSISNAAKMGRIKSWPGSRPGSRGAGPLALLEAPTPWGPSPASSWDFCFSLRKQAGLLTGMNEKLPRPLLCALGSPPGATPDRQVLWRDGPWAK